MQRSSNVSLTTCQRSKPSLSDRSPRAQPEWTLLTSWTRFLSGSSNPGGQVFTAGVRSLQAVEKLDVHLRESQREPDGIGNC
jgi:hypothetical protein